MDTEIEQTIETLKTLNSEWIIFASEERNCFVLDVLRKNGIKSVVLLGSYKGMIETSYLIASSELHKVAELVNEQESILSLGNTQKDGTRESNLVYLDSDGQVSHLGMFKEITQQETVGMDSWSYDPARKKFFGVV